LAVRAGGACRDGWRGGVRASVVENAEGRVHHLWSRSNVRVMDVPTAAQEWPEARRLVIGRGDKLAAAEAV
jgi:hypothetical protein